MPVQLVLGPGFDEGADACEALKDTIRTPLGDLVLDEESDPTSSGKKNVPPPISFASVVAKLPERGGLLRVGEEILCYDSFDASGNTLRFTLASAGRGLLGTDAQPHQPTEGITYLGALPVAILAANVGADDAELRLVGTPTGFPSHGLVRVEDELVHYTNLENGVLFMPRGSAEPGEKDAKGPGLFRGRFGTQRAEHPAGAAIVLHPFRYWDCWSDLADAPELTYFGLSCEQPDAYWRRVFWKERAPAFPGPQLGVLQRTSDGPWDAVPWDAAPEPEKGLALLLEGKLDGEGNRIEVQADRVEWRVFVRHLPGSYDPLEGLAHGWKTTPRLELFGVEYMGPNRTFARVDR
jgi:hypothetical protein